MTNQPTNSLLAAPRCAWVVEVVSFDLAGGAMVGGMKQRLYQHAVADPREQLF